MIKLIREWRKNKRDQLLHYDAIELMLFQINVKLSKEKEVKDGNNNNKQRREKSK